MDHRELANALIELTGSLEPGQEATSDDLQLARIELARVLLSGQSLETVRTAASQSLAMVEALHRSTLQHLSDELLTCIDNLSAIALHESVDGPPTDSCMLATLRTTPLQTDFDPSLPSWARGMKITRSLGPFSGPAGIQVWVDFFHSEKLLPLVYDQNNKIRCKFLCSWHKCERYTDWFARGDDQLAHNCSTSSHAYGGV
ncbi:hypothetical protein [Dictyobacter formicarum]|uniref:Uncharacterized protein n=1 Tax=Dictyobacter formicarum TaxID=2778368 RepID=A0ABQ3VPK8_9CHLR|nr:hypothetical protein [Dictyobacter formicarum]GHO87031.1 hypothetical protein KSZ_50370 [Dictyobacter formicarum]